MKELTDKELKILLETEERIRLKKQWGGFINEMEVQEEETVIPQDTTTTGKEATILTMTPKKTRRRKIKQYAAAASIALFLIMGLFWVFQETNIIDSPQALAMRYSQEVKKPYIAAPTKSESDDNQLIAKIYQAYEYRDFSQVIQLIRSASASISSQHNLKIVLGYSYYQLGEYQNAANTLHEVADASSDVGPKEDAYWYLALSELQLGRVQTAKNYLDKLIEEYDLKDEVAKRLLEDIKQLD